MIPRNTQILSVSLPPDVYEDIARLARREKKTKSALVREMVKIYRRWKFEKDWQKIRTTGEEITREFNLKNEDDLLKLIHSD